MNAARSLLLPLFILAAFSGIREASAGALNPSETRVVTWARDLKSQSPRCRADHAARLKKIEDGLAGGIKQESQILEALNALAAGPQIAVGTAAQFADFVSAKSAELKNPQLVLAFVSLRCVGRQRGILGRLLRDESRVLQKNKALVKRLAVQVRREVTEASGYFDYLALVSEMDLIQEAIERGLFKSPSQALSNLKALKKKSFEEERRLSAEFSQKFHPKDSGVDAKQAAELLRIQIESVRAAAKARREFEKILVSLG